MKKGEVEEGRRLTCSKVLCVSEQAVPCVLLIGSEGVAHHVWPRGITTLTQRSVSIALYRRVVRRAAFSW